MLKFRLTLLLIFLFIAGCLATKPTQPPITPTAVLSSPTATVMPIASATPLPPPTLTPTPIPTSRWQCDPSGGLTCFVDLTVAMFNAQEGWAVGGGGVILHYTTPPGASAPTWQWVTPQGEIPDRFYGLSVFGPNEWWGLGGASIVHYHNGKIEDVPVPIKVQFLDIVMFDNNEGWVVGDKGVILHYSQGQWQQIPSPVNTPLVAIDMLNPEEGWAIGTFGVLLHYHNGQWERVEVPSGYYRDIDMVNEQEGWIVGEDNVILHYHNGQWKPEVTA